MMGIGALLTCLVARSEPEHSLISIPQPNDYLNTHYESTTEDANGDTTPTTIAFVPLQVLWAVHQNNTSYYIL